MREKKKAQALEKDIRIIVAFALNFIVPGFGLCFSGLIHRLKWLLLVGLGLMAITLLFGAQSLAYYHFYILLASQDSDVLPSLSYSAIGFIIASLGAVVESDIKEVRAAPL